MKKKVKKIFMVCAVLILVCAAKTVKAADSAFSANISTSPVTSSSGVSATWYGYCGQTFYCNVWDRNATNTMKSGSVTLKKNGAIVIGNSGSQSFSVTNYCNWANFPLTLYEPGEYTYEINIKDINGNGFSGGREFYIYDVAPVISSQPTAKSVREGNSVTFSTSISQGTNVSYQWYYSTSSTGTGTAISGATSSSYRISSATKAMNGRYYYCMITNYGNSIKTNSAKLTVYNAPTVTSPTAKTIKEGNTATFSVTVSGGNPSSYTYQWYYASSASGSGTRISGATSRTYSVTGSKSDNGRYYYCQVSNGQYTVTSGRAKLTVYNAPTVTNPTAKSIKEGNTATFSVTASGGNPSSYTYQWYYASSASGSGTRISGATSRTYSVTGSKSNNGRYYYCQVGNGQYTVPSGRARLTVYYPPTVYSPISITVNDGETAVFSVGVNRGNPSNYTCQWFYADSLTGYGISISGATSESYTVTGNNENNGRYYYCQVSNGQYIETTTRAQLTVTGVGADGSSNGTSDVNYQENNSYMNTDSTTWAESETYREIWIIRRENKKNKANKKNRVKLPDMKIKKIKRTKKKIQITWKRNKKVDGYKIFMARDKKFKKCIGGVEINKNKFTQYTIQPNKKNEINLNAKKMKQIKYIQIVGWKKINGKTYYTDLNKNSLKKVK